MSKPDPKMAAKLLQIAELMRKAEEPEIKRLLVDELIPPVHGRLSFLGHDEADRQRRLASIIAQELIPRLMQVHHEVLKPRERELNAPPQREDHCYPKVKSLRTAPGSFVLRVADFLCPKKVYERVFLQYILDMREEYFEALAAEREEKARWVLIRGYLALAATMALQLFASVFAKIIKTVWPS